VDALNSVDLRPQQIGLFLDVDGTILDLAPSPEAVEVPAGLLDALAAAERRLDGALALVSGRPLSSSIGCSHRCGCGQAASMALRSARRPMAPAVG